MQDERQVDPRVSAAGMHWAHRMVTNGVPLADFQQVAGSISSWEEWCPAWVLRGGVHFDLGAAAESEGRLRSAGDHFQTASVCYHFGKFLFVHDLAQMRGRS